MQNSFQSKAVLQSTTTVGGSLPDLESSKSIARRIMETYDRDRNGLIDNIEVVPMIIDAYKSFNRVFSPSTPDIDSYLRVLDQDGDGKVTQKDIEALCSRYLKRL